jgi:hypothetical protein
MLGALYRTTSTAASSSVRLAPPEAGLWYAEDVRANLATEEIAVQFIADTQLAVNRAIVETWKFLHDATDPDTGAAPCS